MHSNNAYGVPLSSFHFLPFTLHKKAAFTLIEILIVILILSILAAVIVPRVTGRAGEAKRAKAIADLATIGSLLQQFRLDTTRFPTSTESLEALRTPPPGITHWQGPYLSTPVPLDPWDHPYIYTNPGLEGPNTFDLISYGADGAPGGQGDAEDISDAK